MGTMGSPEQMPPASELASLSERVAGLELRLTGLTEVVKGLHERADDWPARLAAVRAAPTYAEAFTGDPLVTVRIGTYQAARLLVERALASVQRQTYTNWEVRIVGDNCTDDTAARVEQLGDPRISFVNRPVNGPYPEDSEARWMVAGGYAFNEAAAAARGAWIAPLDQDDEWDPDFLMTLLRESQQARAELTYASMRAVVDGEPVETWLGGWPPTYQDFAFQAAIYHAGLRVFAYDPLAWVFDEPHDWNLARRMLDAGVRFHYVDRLLGTYHVEPDNRAADWWRHRAATRPPFDRRLPT